MSHLVGVQGDQRSCIGCLHHLRSILSRTIVNINTGLAVFVTITITLLIRIFVMIKPTSSSCLLRDSSWMQKSPGPPSVDERKMEYQVPT